MASAPHGVGSEVGPLATVMLHRPGSELLRLTPRNNDALLFDGVPWVAKAQAEHDGFAATLRGRGVEVLYLRDLLEDALEVPEAREEVIDAALQPQSIGPSLEARLRERLSALPPAELCEVLVAGLSREEIGDGDGLVERMTPPQDFIVAPLPNALFTRDSSVWLRDLPAPSALRGHPAALRRRHGAQRVAGGR
jgi:arginine deiminase